METAQEQHGKYRLIAELGQGGTANVYLAVARGPNDFNKLVVLKILKGELAGEDEFRRMFMSEARLSARLNHPNVVQTNEVFETDGRPVIVMEYLEGQPLSRIVALARSNEAWQARFTLSLQLCILIEALSGLHYSHELADYDGTPLGVVHRDMTPQNVFVSYDGRVCVLDFGIAKLKNVHETQTGVVKGKLRYMPVEQLVGDAVDRRADIFAIGVMLWEAATGTKLWDGLADATVVHHVFSGRIPSPRETKPDVPEELERIVMKALSHDREQRYGSAADLQADLEAFTKHQLPSLREVASLVSEMFVEQRRKMKALVEGQLASLAAKKPSEDTDSGLRMPTGSFLPTAHTSSLSEPPAKAASDPPSRFARASEHALGPHGSSSRKVWLGGFALIVVTASLFAWRQARRETAASDLGRPASAAGRVEQAPARPALAEPVREATSTDLQTARAEREAVPSPAQTSAEVEVVHDDGSPEDRRDGLADPSSSHHTRDEKRRRATDARRARTRVAAYPATREQDTPSPAPADQTSTSGKAVSKPKAAQTDECDVPYYIDASGIRRIRRECLTKTE